MGEKHWYMPLDAEKWLADGAVCLLKPATRAIWMDAICHMFMLDRCGELTGTTADLARLCRCQSVNEMRAALDDLKLRNAADVTERNGLVTLINRRMRREWTDRKSARDRQQRHRHKDDDPSVTQVSRDMSHDCSFNCNSEVKGKGVQGEGEQGDSSDLSHFLVETGLAMNCGPKQIADVKTLLAVSGRGAAIREVQKCMSEGIGGIAAITYATKKLAGERAQSDLKRGAHRKPLDKAVKYDD